MRRICRAFAQSAIQRICIYICIYILWRNHTEFPGPQSRANAPRRQAPKFSNRTCLVSTIYHTYLLDWGLTTFSSHLDPHCLFNVHSATIALLGFSPLKPPQSRKFSFSCFCELFTKLSISCFVKFPSNSARISHKFLFNVSQNFVKMKGKFAKHEIDKFRDVSRWM